MLAGQGNDLSAAVVDEVAELVGRFERLEERPLGHDDLEVAGFADFKADVNETVAQFKDRRLLDVEHGIKVSGRQATPPSGKKTTEPDNGALANVNDPLQPKDCIGGRKKRLQPVSFWGMEDVGNRPIPLFKFAPPPLAHGCDVPRSHPTPSTSMEN